MSVPIIPESSYAAYMALPGWGSLAPGRAMVMRGELKVGARIQGHDTKKRGNTRLITLIPDEASRLAGLLSTSCDLLGVRLSSAAGPYWSLLRRSSGCRCNTLEVSPIISSSGSSTACLSSVPYTATQQSQFSFTSSRASLQSHAKMSSIQDNKTATLAPGSQAREGEIIPYESNVEGFCIEKTDMEQPEAEVFGNSADGVDFRTVHWMQASVIFLKSR